MFYIYLYLGIDFRTREEEKIQFCLRITFFHRSIQLLVITRIISLELHRICMLVYFGVGHFEFSPAVSGFLVLFAFSSLFLSLILIIKALYMPFMFWFRALHYLYMYILCSSHLVLSLRRLYYTGWIGQCGGIVFRQASNHTGRSDGQAARQLCLDQLLINARSP